MSSNGSHAFETWRGKWLDCAVQNKGLQFSDKAIMIRLYRRLNRKTRVTYPSLRTLAKETGMSRSNADKCEKRIIKQGWLRVVGHLYKGALLLAVRDRSEAPFDQLPPVWRKRCIENYRETMATMARESAQIVPFVGAV